jgi:hypothetical protein
MQIELCSTPPLIRIFMVVAVVIRAYRVEFDFNVMKEAEYFVSL